MGVFTGLTAAGDYSTPTTVRDKIMALRDLMPDPESTSSSGAIAPNSYLDEMNPAAAIGVLLEIDALLAEFGELEIAGTPVLTGQDNVAYAGFTVVASGGQAPYVYSIQAGALPAGLTLDADTGEVAGTPTVDGTFNGIVIRVTDNEATTADLASFDLVIDPA